MWSRKVIGSLKHRRSSSTAGSWKKTSAIGGRRIVFEPLEDRRLLSVGMLHPETTGQAAALLASSLSPGSALSAMSNAAISDAAATIPTISQVAILQTTGRITWNVFDPLGVAGSALQIDGVTVAVAGPFAASNGGVNFSGSFGPLLAGTHRYLITASDTGGNTASATNQFTVAGPAISQVVASETSGRMTWNVVSPNGVASSTLQIDGTAIPNVSGPFAASNGGVNFSAPLGTLTASTHSFAIKATDRAGNTLTSTGTFTISAGPIISNVAVSQSTGRISWNVSGMNPVASSTLAIDGTPVSNLSGPFVSPSGGVNFSGPLGTLSVGSHTYLITAIDTAHNVSTSTATFNITSTTSSGPTISQVVVSQSTGRVSWNVVDASGVASSTLAIDGAPIFGVSGPFTASSGVNFSAPLGILADGTHTLTITATGNDKITSNFSETFTTSATTTGTGPTIDNIIVSGPSGTITWNASDPNGVVAANTTLTIDGIAVTPINGPSGTPTSANFSASLGLLNAGTHSFTITATDTLSNTSTLSATFNLARKPALARRLAT